MAEELIHRIGWRAALKALALGALCAALGLASARTAHAGWIFPDNDEESMTIVITPKDQWPPVAITDLVGIAGAEKLAYLEWTAPVEDIGLADPSLAPAASYDVRFATFSVQSVGGSTQTWFDNATPIQSPPPPLAPENRQSVLTTLEPAVQYWFGMTSTDDAGLTSEIDDNSFAAQAMVDTKGIAPVTNLTAVSGAATGEIDLVWTEPRRVGEFDPEYYEIKVSSVGQISNNAEFDTARPLADFSDTTIPAPGTAGGTAALTVTGLTPGATYYFAMRTKDWGTPQFVGDWDRDVPGGLNVINFGQARFIPGRPEQITDLTALYGAEVASVRIEWSAPENLNGVPMDHYVIKMNTHSVADVGGSTTAWWNLGTSTTLLKDVAPVGTLESLEVTDLEITKFYYFGIKSYDMLDEESFLDVPAEAGTPANTRPRPPPPITNLTAVPGDPAGSIELTWSAPDTAKLIQPLQYLVRVSTTGNITDNAEFDAAKPLSDFSQSTPPVPSNIAGKTEVFLVTGLIPNVTYYFAIREQDSSVPPLSNDWEQDAGADINPDNFAPARFRPQPPNAITDLTALTGGAGGEIDLTWSAPKNDNFVPISTYVVRFATFSVSDVGGSTTTWFDAAASSERIVAPALEPGAVELYTVTGLDEGIYYHFGIKSVDQEGYFSDLDTKSQGAVFQASAPAHGVARVTDLRAEIGPADKFGSVTLTWTEPVRAGTGLPEYYSIKVSSVVNIENDATFAAADPLTALAATQPPDPGAAGTERVFVVTGLRPFTTYYFAIRAEAPSFNGSWSRSQTLAWNLGNFAPARWVPNPPEPVTDLTGYTGTLKEGDVWLTWTAPLNENYVPMARYEIRYATYTVDSIGGDADFWYDLNAANTVRKDSAGDPGDLESITIGDLMPISTFYFAIKAYDEMEEESPVDTRADTPGQQARAKPLNLAPATPSGLDALAGLVRAELSWDDLPPGHGGRGLDFDHYFIQRSTLPASNFSQVSTTTATGFTDWPLAAFTTFYFRVGARDQEGLESAPSAAVLAEPFAIEPMQPIGFRYSRSTDVVTVTWDPTSRFVDGTVFSSTSAPIADEMTGYEVYTTSNPCFGYSLLQQNSVGVTSFTHDTGGQAFYYLIHSSNRWFTSEDSLVLSQFGDHIYMLDDCRSHIVVPESEQGILRKEETGYDEDVIFVRQRLPDEAEGKIVQAAEFVPMIGGHTPLESFHFSKPVKISLHFETDSSGNPVPQKNAKVSSVMKTAGKTFSAAANPQAVKHVGMYWHNSKAYKKLYGTVDAGQKTVTVQTPNVGKFQIRKVYRDSNATFDISNITSKVFSPNGDGKNDTVIFLFDNPKGASIQGKIFDLRGAHVADMVPGPQPDTLQWDGKMNGTTVTSGVYVYQLEGDGQIFNGTVVVAR